MQPTINILLRVSRADYFNRCLESIRSQSYPNIAVHASVDVGKVDPSIVANANFQSVSLVSRHDFPRCSHPWNLYCNVLKSKVESGWFMFLDDDDQLANPTAIEKLVEMMRPGSEGVVFQMERWGELIPDDFRIRSRVVQRKHVGMPCILLPFRYKNLAHFDGEKAADYRFIWDVSNKIHLDFIHHTVVSVDVKNEGGYDGQTSK